MQQILRELLIKYHDKHVAAGNFAYFAELARNLPLAKWHEGQHAAYVEIVKDLTALLEKFEPEEAA